MQELEQRMEQLPRMPEPRGAIISEKTGQDFAGYRLYLMAPRDGLDNSDRIRIGRALARP